MYTNDGNAVFSHKADPGSDGSYSITLGDFDNDGDTDFLKLNMSIVKVNHKSHTIKLVTPENVPIPDGKGHLVFDRAKTHVYADGWIIT